MNDNFQTVEVISKTIQVDTNLLKKKFEVLKEENRSLCNMTLSTEENLEKVQSDIKEGTADMDHKLQSLSVGNETLSEKIQTAECINRTLSKGYERLMDRISI